MLNKKKLFFIVLIMVALFVVSSCNKKPSTVEKIFDNLEAVVKIESEFENNQQPLVDLESRDKELYDKIISLGLKEQEQISGLSDEAIENVGKRKEHMEKESEIIEKAKTEFEKVKELIEELEEKQLKEQAEDLYDLMMKRYDVYNELNSQYMEGLNFDKQFYDTLKKDEVSLDEVDVLIENINKAYEQVYVLNENFNQLTTQYNEAKLSFYKDAGLEVTVNEQ